MMKNMKIRKRIIIAFIVIVLLASIAGGVCIAALNWVDKSYSRILEMDGFSQGIIGKVTLDFFNADGSVYDIANYSAGTARSGAITSYNSYKEDFLQNLEKVKPMLESEESQKLYAVIQEQWESYVSQADKLVEEADKSDDEAAQKLQQKLASELGPKYTMLYTSLSALMDQEIASGTAANTQMSNAARFWLCFTIAILVVVLVLAVILSIIMSNSIARPIEACEKRLALLAEGDIHTEVPKATTRDEIGAMLRSLNTTTDFVQDVFADLEISLQKLGQGDLNHVSAPVYKGDFAALEQAVNSIAVSLNDTLCKISEASEQVSGGADQVSGGAQALSQGATEQASGIEELSATIADISQAIGENAENAASAREKAEKTGTDIMESEQRMQELIAAMNEISEKSSEIGKIIKTIDDIAFQTNILALNAAVEAARAGVAGKGFAVVADEVRNLSGKSAEAAKNTASLIEESIRAVENGSKIADDAAKSLATVVVGAKDITTLVENIADASAQQAGAAVQVTQGVEQISSVVQTNSATAQQSAAASEELAGQAQMLKALVGKFHLKNEKIQHDTMFSAPAVERPVYGTASPALESTSGKY